ncbi:MAG: GNAT family N-acetyltransferase [Acidimicrobiales bacterium]|nr:GNAT family N-acetyltransferase [Acidimicrobiales bacterium]
MDAGATIRFATPDDAETIHDFIVGLAIYEKEPDAVEATPESLREQLAAATPPFECLILETETEADDGPEARGFALFFHNYSTWRGKAGLYLEDLYVPEEYRGAGHGRQLLASLAAIAVERGCARLEWQVLDWNAPAIGFYESLGAEVQRDWLPCRLTDQPLVNLAATSR